MNGLAVNKNFTNKEGELPSACIQLGFKKINGNGNFKVHYFHQDFGYDLGQTLATHPIK